MAKMAHLCCRVLPGDFFTPLCTMGNGSASALVWGLVACAEPHVGGVDQAAQARDWGCLKRSVGFRARDGSIGDFAGLEADLPHLEAGESGVKRCAHQRPSGGSFSRRLEGHGGALSRKALALAVAVSCFCRVSSDERAFAVQTDIARVSSCTDLRGGLTTRPRTAPYPGQGTTLLGGSTRRASERGTIADESLQRYMDLRPPRHVSMSIERAKSLGNIEFGINKKSYSQEKSGKVERSSLILDLDETALYGNDGNDLPISMQWMGRPAEEIRQLYRLLVSPYVKDVYDSFKGQSQEVEVVVYTRRPQMLRYYSSFRGMTFGLRYKEAWHKDNHVYFPPEVETAEEIMQEYSGPELLEDERVDIISSLERLLSARAALKDELGLDKVPSVVVTSEFKDISGTAKHLGLPIESTFLYDDNIELVGHPNVITVLPVQSLPEDRQRKVVEFLEERLPARLLDTELVEFLLESKPNERAVHLDPTTGDVTWHVPVSRARMEWAVPTLTIKAKSQTQVVGKVAGGKEKLAVAPRMANPGLFSPVTPDLEGALEKVQGGKAIEAEKGGMKGGMDQVTAAAEALRLHLDAVAHRGSC